MIFNSAKLIAVVSELNNSVQALTALLEKNQGLPEAQYAEFERGGLISEAIVASRFVGDEGPGVCSPQQFLVWLRGGLRSKSIDVNQANSLVHIVDEGVFLLAPAIFKYYLFVHGEEESQHNFLSRKFSRLRKHIKSGDINIHGSWVNVRKNHATKINGWLLPFDVIYGSELHRPTSNPYLHKKLLVS